MPTWTCNVNLPATIGKIIEIDADTPPTPDLIIAALIADEGKSLTATAGEDFNYDDAEILSVEVLD